MEINIETLGNRDLSTDDLLELLFSFKLLKKLSLHNFRSVNFYDEIRAFVVKYSLADQWQISIKRLRKTNDYVKQPKLFSFKNIANDVYIFKFL